MKRSVGDWCDEADERRTLLCILFVQVTDQEKRWVRWVRGVVYMMKSRGGGGGVYRKVVVRGHVGGTRRAADVCCRQRFLLVPAPRRLRVVNQRQRTPGSQSSRQQQRYSGAARPHTAGHATLSLAGGQSVCSTRCRVRARRRRSAGVDRKFVNRWVVSVVRVTASRGK